MRILLVLLLVLVSEALGGIRGPGKYAGVVIFDHWGGCHLYSGIYVMEIAEGVKEKLRPFAGQMVVLDAQSVFQQMNPGDGLIEKFELLRELPADSDDVEGLELRVSVNAAQGEMVVALRNGSLGRKRLVDLEKLGPTLLAKKRGERLCIGASNGPSTVVMTRTTIPLMQQGSRSPSCLQPDARVWLAPAGAALADDVELEPGESVEIPLRFELPKGEYEFLAGYGGGVHSSRTVVSNPVAFVLDRQVLAREPATEVGRPPVSGRVRFERGGGPVAKARVYFWAAPMPKFGEMRAVNYTSTDAQGRFRMEGVMPGRYVLRAVAEVDGAIFTGGREGELGGDVLVRHAATFAVRGRISPGPPVDAAESRVRISMVSGDAYPMELTAPVGADGRYEFRGVPAGRYMFWVGSHGSSFDVEDGDVERDVADANWPEAAAAEEESPFEPGPDVVRQSLEAYAREFPARGYPATLEMLGPPPSWARRDARHAGLLTRVPRRVVYRPDAPDGEGRIRGYRLENRRQ